MSRFIFAFFVLLLSSSVAVADYQTYQEKITDNKIGRFGLYQLRHHLLYPHLKEQWLTKNIQSVSKKQVAKFQADPNNAAANWFFAPAWRKELIRRKDWHQINMDFSGYQDPTLQCYYFESQKRLRQSINSDAVKKLWLSGQSRPDQCDPFFKHWLSELEDPDPVIWQRHLLAFYARNGGLVNYLDQFYQSPENQRLSQYLISIYNDPKQFDLSTYNPNVAGMPQLALAAVNRLAYSDPVTASSYLKAILDKSPNITTNDIQIAARYLGITMAKQSIDGARHWLTLADPQGADETVQHWRLQRALVHNQYDWILKNYALLSSKLKRTEQWLYWVGVAQLRIEGALNSDNPLIALSKRRLYYGYLAAGLLGSEAVLGAKTDYPPTDFAQLETIPQLQRAKALYLANDLERAQVEWNLWVKQQDSQTQHAAAELALSWGWYAKASQSAGWSGRYDLIHLRYPDAYGAVVEYNAERLGIPDYWIYGVMRQESRFEKIATSSVGAQGLMQVMPRTAEYTANKYGIRYNSSADLYDPVTNIEIGSQYLKEMLNQFGHPIYATAAYNAGPSRVVAWKERYPNDLTVWVESIPFDETRNYVKAVMVYSQIYALATDKEWTLSNWTQPTQTLANNTVGARY